MKPYAREVLFVCVENSCRSAMTEAGFRAMVKSYAVSVQSPGIQPGEDVNPLARNVMEEAETEAGEKKPGLLTPNSLNESDLIVAMGCLSNCPVTPKEKTVEWTVPDPGEDINTFREVRDVKKESRRAIQELISTVNMS